MYKDLNKGGVNGLASQEQQNGIVISKGKITQTELKQNLIELLELDKLLFLKDKSLRNLIKWLNDEDYIDKIKYSLEEVYLYLKRQGYGEELDTIKEGLKSKDCTIECINDFYEEVITKLEGVEVYRVSFRYNFILDNEEEDEEIRKLRRERERLVNQEIGGSKSKGNIEDGKGIQDTLNPDYVGMESKVKKNKRNRNKSRGIRRVRNTLAPTKIRGYYTKYKDFKMRHKLEGIQRYDQESEWFIILLNK